MKLKSAFSPPPCVTIEPIKAPPFVTPDGKTLDDLEREAIFGAIERVNETRREKYAKMRRKR